MNPDKKYMSDNYYLRECFLGSKEVPTQSLIKEKMSAPLAAVYFKSMTPKLKVLVGLEPPMKGGGGDWYVPPKDLLQGRTVLKPLKKQYLSKLNYLGIDSICLKTISKREKLMESERNKIIAENDAKWKIYIEDESNKFHEICTLEGEKRNTEKIRKSMADFQTLYRTSINKIESVLVDAACSEIKKVENYTFETMRDKYKALKLKQATVLYDDFTNKLKEEQLRLKCDFVDKLAQKRAAMGDTLHDSKLEKHTTIEKLRQYLECQRLACQVYIALKEREECEEELQLCKQAHKKQVKILTDEIAYKDFEIFANNQREKAQLELDATWQKKVSHIVKRFQMFVSYCLSSLPSHAEFFLNMEKLMLLQLDNVLENPTAESIIENEQEYYEGPRPDPRPYYIFCDKGQNKNDLHLVKDLCPKRCTSNESQMPVIVINKRCMYAACDNFQQFTNKVKFHIQGKRGDEMDFIDNHNYEYSVPVTYTSSQQLSDLKLESSLLQVLQQELSNVRETPIACGICKVPYCFCYTRTKKTTDFNKKTQSTKQTVVSRSHTPPVKKHLQSAAGYQTDSEWENYIKPKQCTCSKTAKQHLLENLPVYMRTPQVYNKSDIPDYETCPLPTLKKMVEVYRKDVTLSIEHSDAKSKDVGTQCADDIVYENLCTCFYDDELKHLWTAKGTKCYTSTKEQRNYFDLVDDSTYSDLLTARDESFALDRAHSLRALIGNAPELGEIFNATYRTSD